MLIAAVVLAVLTTWLTSKYLTQREQSIEAAVRARSDQARGSTVAVVVPIRPLPAGAILSEAMVASRNVPADFVYDDTITVADFDKYKGNVLLRGVERGKPLRKEDVQEVFADFSDSLKDGERAMTINVDEINSMSHMVQPGNRVDLMLVLNSGGNGASNETVVPFLEQIKVLATGQKVTHDDPSQPAAERRVSYSNLTLQVTPTQAARLALATEIGKIRAVLRNDKDKQSVDFDAVTANNLLDDIRERERRAGLSHSGPGEYIEYFIGGKNNNQPVAPVINVPVTTTAPASQISMSAPAGADASAAPIAAPQNLTDLVKMSLGNTATLQAKPTK